LTPNYKTLLQEFLQAQQQTPIYRLLEVTGPEHKKTFTVQVFVGNQSLGKGSGKSKRAAEKDWASEYLDLILSIRVVKDLKEAVQHIQKYGSQHSDAIVTENDKAAGEFTRSVDSACVFVNCSTRFSDGGEFGMGAEMGISTGKLHARGPMGLEELTSYKYVVLGNGQVRK